MRRPKASGVPIDGARLADWADRYADYHKRPTKPKLLAWIDQFSRPDRDLAARVLDSVEYFSHEAVEDALVQRANSLPGWSRSRTERSGKWRFVAFARAAGESGNAMLHKFRIAANLTGPSFDDLFIEKRDLLTQGLTSSDTVVFIDDFAGTGQQIADCWKEVIEELLPGKPRVCLLLVAATAAAIQKITSDTPMKVVAHRVLRDRDNIFSSECRYFAAADQTRILSYCRRADPQDPRGFGECGLALVLAHNAPNNSIPILHRSNHRWISVFPRRS